MRQFQQTRCRRQPQEGQAREREEDWDTFYTLLANYKAKEGHANVPPDYVCKDISSKIELGQWVAEQRSKLSAFLHACKRNDKQFPMLIQQQIEKLNDLGFEFHNGWDAHFVQLAAFKDSQGHANVPSDYVCQDSRLELGKWATVQRAELSSYLQTAKKTNSNQKKCSNTQMQLRIEKLKGIGFELDGHDGLNNNNNNNKQVKCLRQHIRTQRGNVLSWEEYYKLLSVYKAEHKDLHIAEAYKTVTGVKLGVWARNQRCLYAAKMHLEMHGSKVANNNAASCFNLLDNQLCRDRINLLTKIEFPWDMPPRLAKDSKKSSAKNTEKLDWEECFKLLLAYYKAENNYSDMRIPVQYETTTGVKLGKWARSQRMSYTRKVRMEMRGQVYTGHGMLSPQQIMLLDTIGFPWDLNKSKEQPAAAAAAAAVSCTPESCSNHPVDDDEHGSGITGTLTRSNPVDDEHGNGITEFDV